MLPHRNRAALVGVLAISLGLAACAPSGSTPGSGSSSTSAEGFNEQDVVFAQQMLPHHEQAVEMADLLLAKDGIDSRVTEIAQTIKDEQEPEIAQLSGWLEDWDSADTGETDDMGGMHDGMNGMMSDDEMARLETASGVDADRLFLEQMTEHHRGAIEMALTEVDDGESPEAIELARTIVGAQQAEIDEMNEILAAL